MGPVIKLLCYTDCMFNYPGVYASLWQDPAHLSGGPSSTITFQWFAYGSTANFLFRGPIASLNISKESPGTAIILVQES